MIEVDRDQRFVGIGEDARFNGPLSDAVFNSALTSSFVVSRDGMKVRSIRLTLGVGTRIADPSSLPFNSGSTSPTARAAPVVVGIMDMPAARARRMSLWIWSKIFWSLV